MNNPNNNLQDNQRQNTVSNGEIFVGLNILSKIGVIFILIGVIAFSATSGEYLNNFVRIALVFSIGVIMLVSGELFYRKRSVVFANALIYGGTAELFISALIGKLGFQVFSAEAVQLVGLAAAAVGFLLSVRYKSQALAITATVFAALPIFTADSATSIFIGAGCLVMINCAAAVIAHRNEYSALNITGSCFVFFEALILLPKCIECLDKSIRLSVVLTVVFIFCAGFVYISGALVNAAQSGGAMSASETAITVFIQSVLILFTNISFYFTFGKITALIAMIVLAVIYLLCVFGFSLKFTTKCAASNLFINLLLATVSFSILTLVENTANYYAMHGFAAVVLTAGIFIDRKMLRNWGYALLGIAEFDFLIQIIIINFLRIFPNKLYAEKVPLYIVNLILWFGIMAFYIIKKKSDSVVFKIYSCLALLNAGILGSALLIDDLGTALRLSGMNRGLCVIVTMMLCACLWMILGIVSGKLKYLEKAAMPTSLVFYGVGFSFLGFANGLRFTANENDIMLDGLLILITIIVNLISVVTVLDITLQITEKAPKFAKAVGLVVSLYAVLTLTTLLDTNNFVKFTSFIVSIIYIVTAVAWIFVGFKKQNPLLRRFGLALSLLASGKLFMFDFPEANPMERTLLFIGFGVTLLGVAFGYGIAEKKLKQNNKK